MDIQNIIFAVVSLSVMGLLFAILLGIAGKLFAVETDERVPLVRDCLPGANCGGCGYPGCDGLAEAIVAGVAPADACPVGGASCAANVAAVMGVTVSSEEPNVAHVHCGGGCKAIDKAKYEGLQDCNAAMRVAGGPKECAFGCMGLGSCVTACQFDAIHVVDGKAVVDPEACVACAKCVAVCPKKLIDLMPKSKKVHVNCMSRDKGAAAMKVCEVSCIGCKKCENICKFDAIHVKDNIASIDYAKCTNCKMCTKVCPRDCIEPVATKEEKDKFSAMLRAKAEKEKQAAAAKAAAEA